MFSLYLYVLISDDETWQVAQPTPRDNVAREPFIPELARKKLEAKRRLIRKKEDKDRGVDDNDDEDDEEEGEGGMEGDEMEVEKKKTEREIELEMGDDYTLDLRKNWDLKVIFEIYLWKELSLLCLAGIEKGRIAQFSFHTVSHGLMG